MPAGRVAVKVSLLGCYLETDRFRSGDLRHLVIYEQSMLETFVL